MATYLAHLWFVGLMLSLVLIAHVYVSSIWQVVVYVFAIT